MENHPSCIYLNDSSYELPNGIRVYGSPYQPEFCDWAFNLPRGEPCLQEWLKIPDETHLLITHGPPFGYGDKVKGGMPVGCQDLLNEVVNRVRPSVHLFGHIHEDYGVFEEEGLPEGHEEDGVPIAFINASTCNYFYKPKNAPVVFDLDGPGQAARFVPEHEWEDDEEEEEEGEREREAREAWEAHQQESGRGEEKNEA